MYEKELIGRIAYSKAGRDSGRMFIIWDVIDSEYVYIIDGDLRKIERPKKKKLKHLNITNEVVDVIRELIISGESISNAKIRKCLENRYDIKEG
ncbi:MAG: KOW domain-containing RNA-binding protein [Clostridium sp.]|nr:KOW domain-containing RNA-binding protein [Clostridium sp.]